VWLLEIATDEILPHFLIRSVAKSALSKLVDSGYVQLDEQQSQGLQRVNSSSYPRKKRKARIRREFHKYQYKARENRRFKFNTMDTLPNWYSHVISGFADLDAEEFLDIAERWIVDEWGVHKDPWHYNAEPRRDRFSDRAYPSMSHRDGSLPTIERFSTYLEWHAMWCALGELMRTRPLARVAKDDYNSFDRELRRTSLAIAPLWLADLRSAKPLEARFWIAPKDVDTWLAQIKDEDFLVELLRNDNCVIVDGYHDTRSRGFRLSSRVNTALISPKTGAALVRALQSANFHDCDVPKEDERLEINCRPYVFRGWLHGYDTYEGIDERDPLRFDVTGPQCGPGTEANVGLRFEYRLPQEAWVEPKSGVEAFVYESWGESKWDDRDDPVRYDERVRSSGWQLRIEIGSLRNFLSRVKLDLLVEVIRLVIDTNIVFQELLFVTEGRRLASARSALREVIDCGIVVTIAPTKLSEEVDEHLPRIAQVQGVPIEKLRSAWLEFQARIEFRAVQETGDGVGINVVDPDDLAFVTLYLTSDVHAVLTHDKDISRMGAETLGINDVMRVRDYSSSSDS
jgi:predicted nucleic acid-binding protein